MKNIRNQEINSMQNMGYVRQLKKELRNCLVRCAHTIHKLISKKPASQVDSRDFYGTLNVNHCSPRYQTSRYLLKIIGLYLSKHKTLLFFKTISLNKILFTLEMGRSPIFFSCQVRVEQSYKTQTKARLLRPIFLMMWLICCGGA